MLIANIADMHARGKDLSAFRAQWEAALRVCAERGVELITIAGDVYDKSNIHDMNASTGAIVRAVVDPLAEWLTDPPYDRQALIIPGNHDYSGAGSVDALTTLEKLPGVKVVREPKWIQIGTEFWVLCFPWDWSGKDAEYLLGPSEFTGNLMPITTTLLLAHIQVVGARYSGSRTHENTPGSWQVSREFLTSLPFSRFALGDFHARQDLTDGRGGYVGALRQLTHGETGNPAGFEIWDTETGGVEWIELDAAPRYRTEEVREGEPLPTAAPGEMLRLDCKGWVPSKAEALLIEQHGNVKIECTLERQERISRGGEIADGILDNPLELLRLWMTDNGLEADEREGLEAELSAVTADPSAEMSEVLA